MLPLVFDCLCKNNRFAPADAGPLVLATILCFALTAVGLGEDSKAGSTVFKSTDDKYETIYSVEYATFKKNGSDEKGSLLADIYQPKGDGPFPTILMVHGGAWFSGNKSHVSLHARSAADAGYAVVAINYRLAPRYKFPAQLVDLRSGLRFIKENKQKYSFDTERIAAYGYSAGAHLVSLLGVTQNEAKENLIDGAEVKAIVAGGTPCEFSWIADDSERLSFWLGGSREQKPKVYKNASPTSFVDAKDPPFFFFHGTADQIVPLSSAQTMKKLLVEKNVENSFHTVPRASHMGAFMDQKARGLAIQFLGKELSASLDKTGR